MTGGVGYFWYSTDGSSIPLEREFCPEARTAIDM